MTMNSSLKNSVSAAALKDVYRTCERLDLLSESVLRQIQISEASFESPDARLPEASLIYLWNLLEEQSHAPGLGLEIGQTIEADSKGVLASWISQAGSLSEALEIFLKHIQLMNPSEKWEFIQDEQHSVLVFSIADKGYPQSAIERSMAALPAWAELLCGRKLSIKQASFSFKEPSYSELFPPLFGDNILYGGETNSLTIDPSDLRLPVLSSNELLKTMMQDKAQSILAKLSQNISTREKVELLIQKYLDQNQTLTMEEASRLLAKSRQTLYRQLKQENTDFQTIYDQARKEKGLKLITDSQLSLSTISLELGFKDTSSFYKAFRRWTGSSPKEYQANRSQK